MGVAFATAKTLDYFQDFRKLASINTVVVKVRTRSLLLSFVAQPGVENAWPKNIILSTLDAKTGQREDGIERRREFSVVVWWSYGSVFWCLWWWILLFFRCSRQSQGYTSRGCPLGLILIPGKSAWLQHLCNSELLS